MMKIIRVSFGICARVLAFHKKRGPTGPLFQRGTRVENISLVCSFGDLGIVHNNIKVTHIRIQDLTSMDQFASEA